jgi:hypothetical protein
LENAKVISVKLVNTEVIARLEALPVELHAAVEAKFASLVQLVREKVENNLSGAVLQTKTGALLGALQSGVETVGGTMIGFVDIEPGGKPEVYGKTHEYGGKGSYEIVPVNKKALAFDWNGKHIITQYVFHPPAQERSFMRSALREMMPEIVAGLEETIASVLF